MPEQGKLLIDITSAALSKPGAEAWMRQAAALAEKSDSVLGVQVHNSAQLDELLLAAAAGYPLTFHSPVLGEYMMNFAAEDCSVSWQMAEGQYQLMKKYQVERTVFHAALMTDVNIRAFGHGMGYRECMQASCRPELRRSSDSIFVRDYTDSEEYLMRRDRLKNNLQLLRKKYPDILWCVENDFPGFVAGVLRGRDLAYLEHALCFDTGHMWAASKMLDLDFYEELETALASKNVKMIHLHASKHRFASPHETWGDGHLPLDHPGDMDIKLILKKCREYAVKHIVLEIAAASLKDVQTVLNYYYEA